MKGRNVTMYVCDNNKKVNKVRGYCKYHNVENREIVSTIVEEGKIIIMYTDDKRWEDIIMMNAVEELDINGSHFYKNKK